MDRPNDDELVQRAKGGDLVAFRTIYERHGQNVYALALRSLGDAQIAEDAMQETFLRAYRALPRFRGDSALSSWLYRIAMNACHDLHRRRRAVVREEPLEDGDGRLRHDPLSEAPDSQRLAEAAQLRRCLRRGLDRLSRGERDVFVLRHLSELSTREVAEITGRREGTVKNLLFRALRKLRRELAPLHEEVL